MSHFFQQIEAALLPAAIPFGPESINHTDQLKVLIHI